jgi:hypothetical protein
VPLVAAWPHRRAPAVATALAAYAVFLVHAAFDWDWELPAVVVAALCCAAAAAAGDAVPEAELRPARRYALLAAAIVLGGCAIAGARSSTVPGTAKAPQSGAFEVTPGDAAG